MTPELGNFLTKQNGLLIASQELIESQSKKILIVEDTAAHAALIIRAIDNKEWDISHVTRGNEAIEKFSKDPSYLILLDLNLPDYDGKSLISQFKSIKSDPAILIVTSLEDVKESVSAMQCGAWNYVVKHNAEKFKLDLTHAINQAWNRRIELAEKKLAEECKLSQLLKDEREDAIKKTLRGLCLEINNPLSGIITYCNIIKAQKNINLDLEIIEKLIHNAEKITDIVNKLEQLT